MKDIIETRPQWMTDEFFKTSIRRYLSLKSDCAVEINDVVLTYAVPKGENYMSIMYRATVKYRVAGSGGASKVSFIVKSVHEDEHMAKIVTNLFKRETDLYINVIPNLEKILEEKNLKTQLVGRYIHRLEEPLVLVLEDLTPLNFVVADRTKGVDLEHNKLVYSRMAKFHAAGMCYFHTQSEKIKLHYSEQPLDDEDEKANTIKKRVINGRLESNIKELSQHGNKYAKAIKIFKKTLDSTELSFFPTEYVPGKKFNSLIHADLWLNNMLFSYNKDGSPKDVLFVDFQGTHYASVARDFLFYILTSVTLDQRKGKFDELKRFYFNHLVDTLKALDYKGEIPTLQEFNDELRHCVDTSVFVLTFMLPVILAKLDESERSRDGSKAFNFDDIANLATKRKGDKNYMDALLASLDALQEYGHLSD